MKVEILKCVTKYSGFFTVDEYLLRHELFEGGMGPPVKRELIEKGDAAAVLLYDPRRRQVVLTEQFRIGAFKWQCRQPGGVGEVVPDPSARSAAQPVPGAWLVELVAGFIEPGESSTEVIHREAMEEAGCTVDELLPIARYYVSPGSTSETISLYCGRVDAGAAGGIFGLAHEGENIRLLVLDVDTAWDWLAQGRIDSATPYIALQWLQQHEQALQQRWG